ncbi:MAG: hypothetical protein GX114_00935 [Clostridiales bacterium]|nr:hypothetical protein [Clostridiales bacterium]
MVKRITVLLIITALLTGCSTEIDLPSKLSADTNPVTGDKEDSGEVSYVHSPEQSGESSDWVMVPTGDQPDPDAQQTSESVLLNQEQAVRLFLDAWEQNDLEKMNMLTLQPLEEFFRQSDMNFVSYKFLDNGDLAGFVRDGLRKIREYSTNTFDSATIENPLPNGDRLKVSLGDYLNLNVTLVLDRNMWKLNSMSANISGFEEAVPQDWDTLNQLVLTDIKDMDGDGNYELLTMGFRGEWEGLGPEPTSAIGIYTCSNRQIENLYFRDMHDRLESDRVVIEGRMGKVMEDGQALLVLIEKTAQDNLAIVEGPASQYYISLYKLEDKDLIKVGEIDWMSAITDVLDSRIIPEWVELLGVKGFKRNAAESVVLRVGFRNRRERNDFHQTNEGIFVLSHDGDEWYTEWYHEGTYGEYHTVVFEETSSGNQPVKMYYIEDIPYENGEGGSVLEVYHRNGRWTENRLFSEKLNIKAAGDMTGDGAAEFLVFGGTKLKVYSGDQEILWDVTLPRDTKEVPYAWIGSVAGKQRIVAALHMGDYINMKSAIYVWEEQEGRMDSLWQSEALGTDGITAMMLRDLNKDGKPEILVNYTNDYLIWGQFFKIFEP